MVETVELRRMKQIGLSSFENFANIIKERHQEIMKI